MITKELNDAIDATREKLVQTARTPIGYGNAKSQMLEYQKMFLSVINTIDGTLALIEKELAKEENT